MRFRGDPLADPEDLLRRTYAYVAYRLGDGPDAEDVTSEAFARALRYRETYDERRGRPIDWMIGIARRCVTDALAARQVAPAEPAEAAARGDLEDDAIRRLELADAVAALGTRDRELVALRYGADLKAREIASLLGLSTNGVEVALHRALHRLRELLDAGPPPAVARPPEAPKVVDQRPVSRSERPIWGHER
jgi:RNA polymerase sigma-70 factor (ECF subfamily)